MPHPSIVPVFPQKAQAGDFFRGLKLPFAAMGVIGKSSTLKKLTALASVVTLVTLSIVVLFAVKYADDVVGRFLTKPENWLGAAGWYLLVALAFLVLTFIGANVLPTLVLAPLQDPISEATEELCGNFEAPAFSFGALARGLTVGLAHTAARITLLLVVHALIFAVNIVPGVGSAVWPFLASAWTMLWAATEYLAGPLARHLYPFTHVRKVVRSRLALCMGFGAAVYILLWVPILNLFFIPLAIVAGTLLFRGLQQSGDLPAKQPGAGEVRAAQRV